MAENSGAERVPKCHRCGKEFRNRQGLGQHMRHMREAVAKGRENRICPDRRTDEEAREHALLRIRVKSKLGLLGRNR